MSIADGLRKAVDDFRDHIEAKHADDSRFAGFARRDRPDGSTLATRWRSAENEQVWFEVAVRPLIPQIRVGVLTNDRWKSEDFEEKIEESGDTMSEFVELGFEEAGLTWIDPPVEHYREDREFFYFATGFEVESADALGDPSVRQKAAQMLDGYARAFGPFVPA